MANHLSTPTTPPPRYRGFSGALAYGSMIVSVFALLALVGGGILYALTGRFQQAQMLSARIVLWGLVAGGAAALARWLCRGTAATLFTRKLAAGDFAGVGGWLVGMVLAGYIDERGAATTRENRLAIGQPIEIAGPTFDGGHFDLVQHRGKVVLVDFWASWCGPCVAELPHLREAYEKYHDQGLDVVSVSLDFDRDALGRFLKANPMPWPQIFFPEQDGGGFDNPVARQYGVESIPFLMIVDGDGKLAALGVRGPEIEPAVAAALGLSVANPTRETIETFAMRLLMWLMYSLERSPAWLLLLCGWGGAAALALVEAGLRRALCRSVSPSNPAA